MHKKTTAHWDQPDEPPLGDSKAPAMGDTKGL
jgi:hypothetical protein